MVSTVTTGSLSTDDLAARQLGDGGDATTALQDQDVYAETGADGDLAAMEQTEFMTDDIQGTEIMDAQSLPVPDTGVEAYETGDMYEPSEAYQTVGGSVLEEYQVTTGEEYHTAASEEQFMDEDAGPLLADAPDLQIQINREIRDPDEEEELVYEEMDEQILLGSDEGQGQEYQ